MCNGNRSSRTTDPTAVPGISNFLPPLQHGVCLPRPHARGSLGVRVLFSGRGARRARSAFLIHFWSFVFQKSPIVSLCICV